MLALKEMGKCFVSLPLCMKLHFVLVYDNCHFIVSLFDVLGSPNSRFGNRNCLG